MLVFVGWVYVALVFDVVSIGSIWMNWKSRCMTFRLESVCNVSLVAAKYNDHLVVWQVSGPS